MPQRAIRLVPLILVALAAIAPPAEAALAVGGIGLRLLDVPVDARNDPRAQIYIVDQLSPGTVIHRRIEVSNTTASMTHVALYAGAATIANGSFLGAAGHTADDLSTWTSVSKGGLEIAAGGRATATVTISVPSDASPGERYGVVWAEARSAPAAQGGFIQVDRVGIRLYLSVGFGGLPASDFTIDSLTAERSPDGQPIVLASVRNTGGRALDMSGTLQLLAGPGGLSAGPFSASLGTTLGIGDTESVRFALDRRIPNGPWNAQIILRSGLLRRTARATITFPNAGAGPAVNTTSDRTEWLVVALAGLILILLSAALVVARRRNRLHVRSGARRSREPEPSLLS